jgi:hypothetical protein
MSLKSLLASNKTKKADTLEAFLGARYPASKRFGLEGCEALLPGLHTLLAAAAGHGVERVQIGMPHRCVFWAYVFWGEGGLRERLYIQIIRSADTHKTPLPPPPPPNNNNTAQRPAQRARQPA